MSSDLSAEGDAAISSFRLQLSSDFAFTENNVDAVYNLFVNAGGANGFAPRLVIETEIVPEPTGVALALAGLGGLTLRRRRTSGKVSA